MHEKWLVYEIYEICEKWLVYEYIKCMKSGLFMNL